MTRHITALSRFSFLIILFMGMIAQTMAHSTIKPRPPRWEQLGRRKVNFRLDRDEIRITAREGAFKALKLQVKGAPIDLSRVVIHYRNGDTQSIRVNRRIPAGGSTPVLDLPGNRRIITKVVMYYDTKNRAARRATVALWGRH